MTNTAIIPLVSFLAAGAGYIAADFLSQEDPALEDPALGDPALGTPDLFVEAAVRDNLDDLARRLSELEARNDMTSVDRQPAGALETTQTEDLAAMREMLASFKSVETAPPARFQDMVELAIQAREDREEAERDARRDEQRNERMDRTMDDLTTKLGLDPSQSGQMRKLLTDRDIQRSEFFNGMRGGNGAGFDRDTIRESMRVQGETFNTQLQTFLSPQQFEDYQGMNTGGWGRGGGGRDSGGRGGRDA
ncbi:MAG TPA: hypothetical protein QF446_16135 [Planctomycetota bacterium]|jgi:hypothetical protein|nr:hypothetical protein [Planctomycetaceae bacterium]HJM58844.1 hypothetical protein [Planctomycetota bacterium]